MQKKLQHERPRISRFNTRYAIPAAVATLFFTLSLLSVFCVFGFLEHLVMGSVGAVVTASLVIFMIVAFGFAALLYSVAKGDVSWSREVSSQEDGRD